MWDGSTPQGPCGCCRKQRGFSLVEALIAMVFVVTVSILSIEAVVALMATDEYAHTTRQLVKQSVRTADEVTQTVVGSRRMFFRDAIGLSYLRALDLGSEPALSTARLPRPEVVRSLGPDVTGDPRTGNILLFAEVDEPLLCIGDAPNRTKYRIDVFRIVCIYPHETAETVVGGGALARDLMLWRSVRYPSHAQIMGIENTEHRANVIMDLVGRHALEWAWVTDAAADTSLYRMDVDGGMAYAPMYPVVIQKDPQVSEGARRVLSGVQLARTDASSRARRAVLSVDDPYAWVPDGFEVKVVGPDASRHVWIRLVLEAGSSRGSISVRETTRLVLLGDT